MRIELEVRIVYSEQYIYTNIYLDKAGAHATDRIVTARKWSQRSYREIAVTLHRVSVVYFKDNELSYDTIQCFLIGPSNTHRKVSIRHDLYRRLFEGFRTLH